MNLFKNHISIGVLSILFFSTSCSKDKDDSNDSISTTPQQIANHLIFIGLDGWGSYSVEKADMPNVKRMMDSGSYSLEKRAVLPSSSAVNWASMFMGSSPELHGYTEWGSKVPEIESVYINENGIFPTFFSVYREKNKLGETGCLYEWSGIKYLVDTLSLDYFEEFQNYNEYPNALPCSTIKYIEEKKPNIVAIIFDNPDHIGHTYGFDTPDYYSKLTELDAYIGDIFRAVENAGIIDDAIFIITSDHGGISKNHGGKELLEIETPFIISGKNVKSCGKLDIAMTQFDVASTIAKIFVLDQPLVWIGRPLDIFE